MADSQINVDLDELRGTILKWLQPRLNDENYEWMASTSHHLKAGGEDWQFYTDFSGVPHHTGKEKLTLTDYEKHQARDIRTGWEPDGWSVDQLARTLLLLSIAEGKQEAFLDKLEKTFTSSDMSEAIALYQSLAVLPYPKRLKKRAAEGLRSSVTSIFNAVALHNPYPAAFFDKEAWNQLVLKALFVGSPLYKIQDIDRRRNEKLAEMLADYAHERWAANRSVSPELWRPVGPFAQVEIIQDLQHVLTQPNDIQRQAALLALSENSSEKARQLVAEHKSLMEEINKNGINWDIIGRQYDK